MARITVLRGFRDLKEHVSRKAGDTFSASDERAQEIADALPGYIEWEASEEDLSNLRVADLRKVAKERGVALPKNASKAQILEKLEG